MNCIRKCPNYIKRVVTEEDSVQAIRKLNKRLHKKAAENGFSIFPKSKTLMDTKIKINKGISAAKRKISAAPKIFKNTGSAVKSFGKATGRLASKALTGLWVGSAAKKVLTSGGGRPLL